VIQAGNGGSSTLGAALEFSHFNRLFRSCFGDTPIGVRAHARVGGTRGPYSLKIHHRSALRCDEQKISTGQRAPRPLRTHQTERLANIVASAPDINLDSDNLKILSADLIETGGIGNLASRDVQNDLDQWLDGVDLLILDNLSCLTAVVRDNDAESWGPIQEWLLNLRRRGISVLIVHHAGKGGQQRGTSRREDVLDTIISLRRPVDYTPAEGARFEVHLEKARGVYSDAAKPFEAKLECHDGSRMWTVRELEDADRQRVHALLGDGLSVRDIADETGIPKSTVHRIKKAIEAKTGVTNVM